MCFFFFTSGNCTWVNNNLHVIFFYNGEISNIDRSLAEETIGQVLIDFEGFHNNMEIIRLDAPSKIPCLEAFAYYRYED